jgi:cellulose synthase/poly-beta-1,6-N-acetylglucosamine synthase-like glycosyltransferase
MRALRREGRSGSARDGSGMAVELILWGAALALGYTYLGYPILIGMLARWRPRSGRRRPIAPPVTVIMAVHDEAAHIDERIRNLLALDYPRERLEILVGSDGSSDDTAARARACARRGIRVVEFAARRGKAAVINDLVPLARGDLVVMADARQRFAPGALRALAAPFADPRVGVVGGELVLRRAARGSVAGGGIGSYWTVETNIRRSESRFDSTVGASGAIYAVRRELLEPIPADTILDDVLIPMRAARRGYRVVLEPAARAYDRPAPSARHEFARKARTLAGNFQLFARERWLLHPSRNRLWFQTVSHKVLRLLGPLLLVAALVANALLLDRRLYLATFMAQIAFYGAAFAGRRGRDRAGCPSWLVLPYVVCMLNWAVVVGFARFVTARQGAAWDRAAR